MWTARLIVVGFLGTLADSTTQEPVDNDALITTRQSFKIPVIANGKETEKIRELRLFFSRDKGKTWKLHSRILGNKGEFLFKAPEDGMYWLATQAKWTDGSLHPKSTNLLIPVQKLKVESWVGRSIVVGTLGILANPPYHTADTDTHEMTTQRFRIPFRVDEQQARNIREVRLFFSRDQGQTWKLHRKMSGAWGFITFKAPENGTYWFAVQTKATDGSLVPETTALFTPGLKVKVSFKEDRTWTKEDEESLRRVRTLRDMASKKDPDLRDIEDDLADLEARKKAAQKR